MKQCQHNFATEYEYEYAELIFGLIGKTNSIKPVIYCKKCGVIIDPDVWANRLRSHYWLKREREMQ